jgi:uncharacterized protein (DUF1697 family)
MGLVALLRGVNVGGHKRFRPSELVRDLRSAGFDAVSLGAAGTFVVRGAAGAGALREAILAGLPFEAQAMVLPAKDVSALLSADPFRSSTAGAAVDCFVSVLAQRPARRVSMPVLRPEGEAWEVRLFAVAGRCALCVRRRVARGRWYPNEVVEKSLGVAATTRNWATFLAIGEVLAKA